jgi:hypothetical protein
LHFKNIADDNAEFIGYRILFACGVPMTRVGAGKSLV